MGGCAHYCTQALSVSVLVSGEDVWQRFPTGERDDSHPSYRKKIPCLFLPPLFRLFRCEMFITDALRTGVWG